MMGAAFQYYAEVTGEKVKAAQERVVARGVLPNSEDLARLCARRGRRAGRGARGGAGRRAGVQAPRPGASLVEIQALLAENGIERSISGVASMLRSRMYLGEIHFGELHNTHAHEPIIKDRGLFERVQRRTVSRGRQAKSERLLARLGVLRCGTCGSRMVINSYSGNYRCGDTSANPCRRRAAVKADRVEEMVLDAVRAYSATADVPDARRAGSRSARRTRRSNAPTRISMTRSGSSASLDCWAGPRARRPWGSCQALDDAHTARARLGDGGESNIIGPDEIDKLREPAKRLAAWRRLITDTVESVTVAPAMTADGRPSRLWDPSRIDIRFLRQRLARDPVERALDLRADAPRHRQHR